MTCPQIQVERDTRGILKFTQKCYFVDVVPAENDNNIVIVVVFFQHALTPSAMYSTYF